MHVLLALFTASGAECTGAQCPMPHHNPVPEVVMNAKANPPPIDVRPSAHLRTATFALG